MTAEVMQRITTISQQFASGFQPDIPSIKGSGWLIVDPLSAYLASQGYENQLDQIPAKDGRPMILTMTFPSGWMFIPAGSDLPFCGAQDWMWLPPEGK